FRTGTNLRTKRADCQLMFFQQLSHALCKIFIMRHSESPYPCYDRRQPFLLYHIFPINRKFFLCISALFLLRMETSRPAGSAGRPGSLRCSDSKKRHLRPDEDGASVCAKEPDFCELLTDKKTSGRLGASQFSGENPSSAACAWKPCAA